MPAGTGEIQTSRQMRRGSCAQTAGGANRQGEGEGLLGRGLVGGVGGDLATVLFLPLGKRRRAIQSAMKLEFCCTVGCNVEQY